MENECVGIVKMCGDCKKYAAQLMEKLLMDLQEKRKKAKHAIKQYF